MPAHLIKHAMRFGAGATDTYSPRGWNPKLRVTVMGPTPSDSELVWTMCKPDGSAWFEHSVAMPELEDEEMHSTSLQRWESGTDVDAAGTCGFTLRLVNELDGVDELLHDGQIEVLADGDDTFHVDCGSLLGTGLVGLDVYDEHDAPRLKVVVFLGGEVGNHQVEGHVFLDGKRFSKSTYTESGFRFTSNRGTSLGTEMVLDFGGVRAWNNLTDQGWGDADWHMLDQHDGHYEVKITREGKVTRVLSFDVVDGTIVKDDVIEPDHAGRPLMWRVAEVQGAFEGDEVASPGAARAYGDTSTSGIDWNTTGMYWFRNAPVAVEEHPSGYDEETTAAVHGVVDTATRLLATWEETMVAGPDRNTEPAYQSQFFLQCEHGVISDVDRFETAWAAIANVASSHPFSWNGEDMELRTGAALVIRLRQLAAEHIQWASDVTADALAPYRAVLRGDKLAIFEDHPADSFQYHSVNKKIIESPEELADAEFWFFEGTSDIQAKATITAGAGAGSTVSGMISGWRVLGYQFDADHTIVDEFEEQGQGSSAPKSAFAAR